VFILAMVGPVIARFTGTGGKPAPVR
jgi:hypothetical protein